MADTQKTAARQPLALTEYFRSIFRHREIMFTMAVRDFELRHIGTFGGFLWNIFQPVATIAVFWMVFSLGFKAKGPSGTPFVLYFMGGFVPWMLFTEAFNGGVNAVASNATLVKKTIFPTEILAAAQVLSASSTHIVLVLALAGLATVYGYAPGWSVLAVLYFYAAMACFSVGLSWLLGSLQVFHRDIGQMVGVVVNLWFWLTPIAWVPEILPSNFVSLLKWNPIYYVVEGYRGALIHGDWLWLGVGITLRFWVITLCLLLVGSAVFRRLKPDFADVL